MGRPLLPGHLAAASPTLSDCHKSYCHEHSFPSLRAWHLPHGIWHRQHHRVSFVCCVDVRQQTDALTRYADSHPEFQSHGCHSESRHLYPDNFLSDPQEEQRPKQNPVAADHGLRHRPIDIRLHHSCRLLRHHRQDSCCVPCRNSHGVFPC